MFRIRDASIRHFSCCPRELKGAMATVLVAAGCSAGGNPQGSDQPINGAGGLAGIAGASATGGDASSPAVVPPKGTGGSPGVLGGGGTGAIAVPSVAGAAGTTPIGPGTGGNTPVTPGAGGVPGGAGGAPYDVTPYLSPDGSYFIKAPPGDGPVGPDAPTAEYCFNVLAHNAQTPLAQDPSSYQVKASEYYHAFQYKVPYTKPAWALSTRPIIDNNKVLHHWLLFQMSAAATDGAHADEIGLQIGNALLTGWAPGGNPLSMPPGVGLELPPPGSFFSMEYHYYNTTGATQEDRSGARVCVTYTPPQNPASLTWFGTENINIPPSQKVDAVGNCTTWKKKGDVHFIQVVPHMHKLGTRMKTVINRSGGGQDVLLDKPFSFTDQRAYAVDVVAHAGDTFTTTCSFQNSTTSSVGFGTSTSAEMCYNFVIYYPAHALDGLGGIEGSGNMCLF